jgi:hypothetical protein
MILILFLLITLHYSAHLHSVSDCFAALAKTGSKNDYISFVINERSKLENHPCESRRIALESSNPVLPIFITYRGSFEPLCV